MIILGGTFWETPLLAICANLECTNCFLATFFFTILIVLKFQILFKKMKVDNVFIAYDAVLALYATGRQEGVVVDIGHRHAYAVPVVKGMPKYTYFSHLHIASNKI